MSWGNGWAAATCGDEVCTFDCVRLEGGIREGEDMLKVVLQPKRLGLPPCRSSVRRGSAALPVQGARWQRGAGPSVLLGHSAVY
jgi:hypothetical protein